MGGVILSTSDSETICKKETCLQTLLTNDKSKWVLGHNVQQEGFRKERTLPDLSWVKGIITKPNS